MTLLNVIKSALTTIRLSDNKFEVCKEDYTSSFPLGRVPNVGPLSSRRNCLQINRYLRFQNIRLIRHAKKGNFEAIVLIFLMLLKNSRSFQIALFHRTKTYWYWGKPASVVLNDLRKCMDKLRTYDMSLLLKRFYVIKSKTDPERNGQKWDGVSNPLREGEKLRPVGSPDLPSAVLSKALTDLLTFIFEPSRISNQHGYRPGKGVHTVVYAIVKKYLSNKDVYLWEYDFKSYFNKVALAWVRYKLEEKSKILSNLIPGIILKTYYRFDNIEKEEELSLIGLAKHRKKFLPLIFRSGLPQGLSMSPLLSTLAQEFMPPHEGNFAYADDGIFMSEENEEFYFYMESLGGYGVSIAEDKTKAIDDDHEVKFCGMYIHFGEEYVRYEESKIKFDDPGLFEWLSKVSSHYGKKPYRWTWDIKKDSYITRFNISWKDIPLLDLILTYCKALWDWSEHKGLKYIPGFGFFDISRSSTYCVNALIEDSKVLALKNRGIIKIPVFTEIPTLEVYKGDYIESYIDASILSYTHNYSEHIERANLLKRQMELEKD